MITYSYGYQNGWGPKIEGQTVKNFLGQDVQLRAYKNNVKDFYQTGHTYINSVAVSGGDDKNDFRLGLTAHNQTGVIPNNEYDKYNVSFNGGRKFNDKLEARISFSYAHTTSQGRPAQGSNDVNVLVNQINAIPRTTDINWLKNNWYAQDGTTVTQASVDEAGKTGNLYWTVNKNKNTGTVDRMFGSAVISYKPVKGLTITNNLGTDFFEEQRRQIYAWGTVGLPDGQMGNSEVGHLNIGAGRVVYQDLVKINRACRDNSIMENPEVKAAFEYAKKNGVNMHFMGLVSDGGVHSSLEHLFKLCDISAAYGLDNTYVHCFMDGRDTDPRSGKGFVADLEKHLAATTGRIATVIGRYYAMDRDKRWERVKIAYDALVNGIGERSSDMVEAVQKSYDEGVTDEFIKPFVRIDENGQPVGMIRPNDVVVFFNYRNDRAKELTVVLTQEDMPAEGMHTMPLYYCCMTPYDAKFTGLHILFDKENVPNTIGEYVSKLGLRQLRIAETEKYAHVTFFLNGGREAEFEGEERILVASPKVATYDLQPEMSAPEVADKLAAALGERKFDFICLNFANGDMVGHTGVYEAIVKAVKAVDGCVAKVVEAAKANGYEVVMIADHGNADNAVNADGTPNTAHSLNPVPIVVVSDRVKSVHDGILADVAPTVLRLMGLEQPAEMTGKALVELK